MASFTGSWNFLFRLCASKAQCCAQFLVKVEMLGELVAFGHSHLFLCLFFVNRMLYLLDP